MWERKNKCHDETVCASVYVHPEDMLTLAPTIHP